MQAGMIELTHNLRRRYALSRRSNDLPNALYRTISGRYARRSIASGVLVTVGVAVGVAVTVGVGVAVAVAVLVGVTSDRMPCGPAPAGTDAWQTVQSLNVPAWPCSAIFWMLSLGWVLGRMACGLP